MVVGDFGAVADLGGQNGVRHSHPTDLRRRSRQSRNRPLPYRRSDTGCRCGDRCRASFHTMPGDSPGSAGPCSQAAGWHPAGGLSGHRGQAAFPIFLSAPQSGPGRAGLCRHPPPPGPPLSRRISHRRQKKTAAVQDRRIKRDRLEGADLGLPLDDQGQRWGHHTPDVQSAVVQYAEKAGGIDPPPASRLWTGTGRTHTTRHSRCPV